MAYSTADGSLYDSYYEYYSSNLDKPIEGFVMGYTFEEKSTLIFKTLKDSVDWGKGSEGRIVFGYYTFDNKDNLIEHFGEVDFSDGNLNSFTFEHLARYWTDSEWDQFTKDQNYHMPDAIIYEYVGGTYTKYNQ